MRRPVNLLAPFILTALTLTACAAPPVATGRSEAGAPAPAAPKRITIAIAGDPFTLINKLNSSGTVRGIDEVERLVHAGFSTDGAGVLRPVLAEAVPSVENGLWKVFPDGRMETTWKIRDGARWHDGAAVTPDDALFAATLATDREVPPFRSNVFDFVQSVTSPDARTVVVTWKQPYIDASIMFTSGVAMPLPKHLLFQSYLEDKAGFSSGPFWTEGFVGAGPYKVRAFERGSFMVVDANDQFVLGRPRIDSIEVKFIVDPVSLVANVLAGAVDISVGRGVSLDQGVQVKQQWQDGVVELPTASLIQAFPQLLEPNPPIIGNPEFRRALLHATNRQEMTESIGWGLVKVADSFIGPEEAEYPEVEKSIVRYEYDPRRATQRIDGLGSYTRGGDGFYVDGSGQRLTVEIRATGTDVNTKAMYSLQDYWQRVGVAVTAQPIPPQLASDLEYRATFPGFNVQRQGGTLDFMRSFKSSEARVAENRFVGSNNSRYQNPELDALIEKYNVTIPFQDRMEVANRAMRILTENVTDLTLWYDPNPYLVSKRLDLGSPAGSGVRAWNVYEWDVK